MTRIVLGSASPRRAELLRQIGYDPIVRPANIDEEQIRLPDARDLVRELAVAKYHATVGKLKADGEAALLDLPVLAADTVVAGRTGTLEKAADAREATRMLNDLSGTTHSVFTGVTVGGRGASPRTEVAETEVTFAALLPEEIEWYIASGEWHGVAGAYRIQGLAARFITSVSGSYSNVVGLPLHIVYSILSG